MQANSNDRARITTRVTAHEHQDIEEHSITRLGQNDMQRFVDALDNPTPISERLAVSLKQHLETRQHDTGSCRSTVRWVPTPR